MLIGISGKIGSGKDTVGKIINYLITGGEEEYESIEGFLEYYDDAKNEDGTWMYPYEIKKFADTLKDMVCMLIGCTRQQLEDADFKNTELGEEWWYYQYHSTSLGGKGQEIRSCHTIIAYPDKRAESLYKENTSKMKYVSFVKLTPRLLLQLLGTECGRQILHPNIWVNALFSKYKGFEVKNTEQFERKTDLLYPNWIITDMRFPNEMQAVKDRQGITIRINRRLLVDFHGQDIDSSYRSMTHKVGKNIEGTTKYELIPLDEHESETVLDNAEFDYTIDNNGTIEELIEKVKQILILEKIIS